MAQITITVEPITLDDPNRIIKLIKFVGQLDESNVDEEAKKFYKMIEESPIETCYIFDFDNLEYMNSKSIGYLTDWYSKISEKKGKLIIARPRENIVDILSVVGITQLIPMTMSLDEAKLELMKEK